MKFGVLVLIGCAGLAAQDEKDVVFRSDTTLVRVDVQVLDRDNKPVQGLEREAFVLKENGTARVIKNFVREEMPIDLLFLIDVSGSMRPHVERMASAAHQALPSLRKDDRVAIMVFDRQSRVRMPFQPFAEGQKEFDQLLKHEKFNGGTDITRSLYDAAAFMRKQARKDARRAIVLLTDDQTEFEADEEGVVRSLHNADTVLSALLVPNMVRRAAGGMPPGGNYPRGGRRGGGWGGVVIGGPGIGGYPRRSPGGGYPGGGGGYGSRTKPAGSAEIATESGGDSMQADAAYALETTLNRLRQRYALYFNLPAGVTAGDTRNVSVTLEASVKRQYPEASLRYRRTYNSAISSGSGAPTEEVLETVPMRPAPNPLPTVTRRRTTDGSSSGGPNIPVH